jgi:mannose/fructose/N-acetylgalactosamine-specific phosphotransferase system component IIB
MSEWLLRIDDRYIHGQVCLGWCEALEINKIILCDNKIAESDFEQELFQCGLAEDQELLFLTTKDLATKMQSLPTETTMVVFASPDVVVELKGMGAMFTKVTIGGLHHRQGSRKVLDYIYLTEEMRANLRALLESGITICCQSLPTAKKTDLRSII